MRKSFQRPAAFYVSVSAVIAAGVVLALPAKFDPRAAAVTPAPQWVQTTGLYDWLWTEDSVTLIISRDPTSGRLTETLIRHCPAPHSDQVESYTRTHPNLPGDGTDCAGAVSRLVFGVEINQIFDRGRQLLLDHMMVPSPAEGDRPSLKTVPLAPPRRPPHTLLV